LDKFLCVTHITSTADQQRHTLMETLWLDIHDPHISGAGSPSCLFHNPCQWIGFVQ